MLEARELSFSYVANTPVLRDLDCGCSRSRITCLMGRNGVGKSTLLRLFGGILTASKGKIYLDNEQPKSGAIVFVPDRLDFYPRLTAIENVKFLVALHSRKKVSEEALSQALESAGLAKHRHDVPSSQLSRGQRRRILLATLELVAPAAVVLDEPLSGLDVPGVDETTTFLKRLRGQGAVVVVATHDITWAASFGDRIIVLGTSGIALDAEASAVSPDEIRKAISC